MTCSDECRGHLHVEASEDNVAVYAPVHSPEYYGAMPDGQGGYLMGPDQYRRMTGTELEPVPWLAQRQQDIDEMRQHLTHGHDHRRLTPREEEVLEGRVLDAQEDIFHDWSEDPAWREPIPAEVRREYQHHYTGTGAGIWDFMTRDMSNFTFPHKVTYGSTIGEDGNTQGDPTHLHQEVHQGDTAHLLRVAVPPDMRHSNLHEPTPKQVKRAKARAKNKAARKARRR
jgi:hypothetical protein